MSSNRDHIPRNSSDKRIRGILWIHFKEIYSSDDWLMIGISEYQKKRECDSVQKNKSFTFSQVKQGELYLSWSLI